MFYDDCMDFEEGPNKYDCKHRDASKYCMYEDHYSICPFWIRRFSEDEVLYRLYGSYLDGRSMEI